METNVPEKTNDYMIDNFVPGVKRNLSDPMIINDEMGEIWRDLKKQKMDTCGRMDSSEVTVEAEVGSIQPRQAL